MDNELNLSNKQQDLLRVIGEYVVESDKNYDPPTEELLEYVDRELEIEEELRDELLSELDEKDLVNFSNSLTGPELSATARGITYYATHYGGRENLQEEIEELIVNDGMSKSKNIAEKLDEPEIIISACLDEIDQIKLIQLTHPDQEERIVTDRRLLEKRYERQNKKENQ